MSIQMEVGKYYLCRNGTHFGGPVTRRNASSKWSFDADIKLLGGQHLSGTSYTSGGFLIDPHHPHDLDFVQECDDQGKALNSSNSFKPKIGGYYITRDRKYFTGPLRVNTHHNYIFEVDGLWEIVSHRHVTARRTYDKDGLEIGSANLSDYDLVEECDIYGQSLNPCTAFVGIATENRPLTQDQEPEYGKPIHEMKLEDYKRIMKSMEESGQKLY